MATVSSNGTSWDERHARGGFPPPHPWLRTLAPLVAAGLPGPALDVACGLGQNALWLARLGCPAVGIDASATAVARARREAEVRGVPAAFERVEVSPGRPLCPSRPGPWGAVVVTHFLDRSLFPTLLGAVAPGGVLAYVAALSHPLRPSAARPRRRAFLLEPGELLALTAGLLPLAYGEWADAEGAEVGLLARRPGPSAEETTRTIPAVRA